MHPNMRYLKECNITCVILTKTTNSQPNHEEPSDTPKLKDILQNKCHCPKAQRLSKSFQSAVE